MNPADQTYSLLDMSRYGLLGCLVSSTVVWGIGLVALVVAGKVTPMGLQPKQCILNGDTG